MNKKLLLLISLSLLLGFTPVFAQVIDKDAPSITRDQQILDDLIVDGSACVGSDCVNGESFGFDTGRYKENNLRVHFDDTSTSASFPKNDWRIVINDSSNGGAEYFGIDDATAGRSVFRIEAGAPSHSLYVDDGGRIGVGTSTPVVDVHIKSGNTPTVRLEQDGSSGFTPQTWDLAGNETNFFVRDATNGSTLPFRIRPGAPTNSIYVNADGDVGIGTSSPLVGIHVARSGQAASSVVERIDKSSFLKAAAGGTGGALFYPQDKVFFVAPGNGILDNGSGLSEQTSFTVAGINGNVGIGTWSPAEKLDVRGNIVHSGTIMMSDKRLKKNVKKFEGGIKEILELNPITFEYNGKGGTNFNESHIGIVAQELQSVIPSLVKKVERKRIALDEGIDSDIKELPIEEYLGVKENEIKYLLINAIKDQQDIIQNQKQEIEELKSFTEGLSERIEALEKRELPNTNIELRNGASLGQNYPNPYANRTQVEYYLPSEIETARIIVHDINGKLITAKSVTEKGKGTVTFLADDLPTGQYTYTLEVDGRIIDTKQMSVSYR